MLIHEMNTDECFEWLSRTRLARLACAYENQPYVVPVYLAYYSSNSEGCFYGFTTPGQKVEWLRANPLVCVELDEVTSDNQWISIVAFGKYEELPNTLGPDGGRPPARAELSHQSRTSSDTAVQDSELQLAYHVLQAHAMWWEPAATTRALSDPAESFVPIFYKIWINKVTGRLATRD